jgi:diguanylate cyclase (GGDEF)-like protein
LKSDGEGMIFGRVAVKTIAAISVIVFLAVLAGGIGFARQQSKKSVLFLNSYHKGYKWSDDVLEGVRSVLGPYSRDIELVVEEMDTQRIEDAEYIQRLVEVYRYKFRNKRFDVIVASDDPAFNFLRQYHQELFAGTPVIFCGVNYFDDAMLAGQDLFTGVVEAHDIKSTIEIALQLHPATKNIYVINDNTITGKAIGKTFAETAPHFAARVNFISLADYDMDGILATVAALPTDSLVLFMIFFQDVTGRQFTYNESIAQIAAHSKTPIYGVWDFALGHGIVGGMLTSGYYQGEMAAKLAQKVLAGEKPAALPVVKTSPNRFMFDSIWMKRFAIKNSDLPPDSIIINDSFSGKKQVLVLNSYNYGMSWTEGIIAGIKNVLDANSNVDLYFEFMDTKRNNGPEYFQKLYEAYKYKFSDKRFDAIITSDDDAYNLLLKYHGEVFPGVPVVFCGVNYFQESQLEGNKYFTGVVEAMDIKKTLDLALKLHPAVKRIVVVNDKTPTGAANKKVMEEIMPGFPAILFTFYEDMNMADVQDKVASLAKEDLILLLSFNRDKSNNLYSYEDSIRIISEKANVPIYSVWDFYLGNGIVGGMLTSGYHQGEIAAGMTARLLAGEKPEAVPVVKDSPNKYMFDYYQLQRFNIDARRLPAESIVINKPVPFYDKHQTLILGLLLSAAAVQLLVQRKKAQDRLRVFATTDVLTGLFNRNTGLVMLQRQLEYAKRYNIKFTLCFIDVNDLKAANDTYGHTEGDKLIRVIGRILKERLRKSDILCRFGGDEFIMGFANCDRNQASIIWKAIEDDIAACNERSEFAFTLSVSYGFAEYDPAKPVSVQELVKTADSDMYVAKRQYKRKH